MIILFQILFTVFALFAIVSVINKKKQTLLGLKGFIFWILFWLVADVFVWWPESTHLIANLFGIGRGADFVFYISIALIFYLLFRLNIKIEGLNRSLTKVVRQDALKNVDDEQH